MILPILSAVIGRVATRFVGPSRTEADAEMVPNG